MDFFFKKLLYCPLFAVKRIYSAVLLLSFKYLQENPCTKQLSQYCRMQYLNCQLEVVFQTAYKCFKYLYANRIFEIFVFIFKIIQYMHCCRWEQPIALLAAWSCLSPALCCSCTSVPMQVSMVKETQGKLSILLISAGKNSIEWAVEQDSS